MVDVELEIFEYLRGRDSIIESYRRITEPLRNTGSISIQEADYQLDTEREIQALLIQREAELAKKGN